MQQLELRLRTMTNRLRRLRFWVLAVGAAGLLWGGAPCVAPGPGSSESASNTVATATAGTNVAAIPLAEVAPQAEAAFGNLQSIEGNLSADQATIAIQQELPGLARESSVRLEESSKMLGSNPSLESLRRLNGEWQGFRNELADWKGGLKKRITQLDEDRERLTQLEQAWKATHASVLASNVPPEVVAQACRNEGLDLVRRSLADPVHAGEQNSISAPPIVCASVAAYQAKRWCRASEAP